MTMQNQPHPQSNDQQQQSAGQKPVDSSRPEGQSPPRQSQGSKNDGAPREMHEAGEQQSGQEFRRGALDAQYGTDSSSKTGAQAGKPQASSGAPTASGASESSTGADRDTMTGVKK